MISTHLGLKVEHHDDGSAPGMYDLKIIFTNGSYAAVEVTTCADSESIATWNLMNGDGKVWIAPELRGGWSVAVNPSTRVQKLKKELPKFLSQLEEAGITQTYAQSNSKRKPRDRGSASRRYRSAREHLLDHRAPLRTKWRGSAGPQ
jgi:hypothetical protein